MKIVLLKDIQETTTSHNTAGRKKVMVGSGVINHLTQFSQVRFKAGEVATEHSHTDMYEVFLIEKGTGTIKLNGKNYNVEKDMCIIVEPNDLHEVTNNGTEELIITYFGIEKK